MIETEEDDTSFNTTNAPDLPPPESRGRKRSMSDLNIQSVTIPTFQTQQSQNNEKFTTYSLCVITLDGDEWSVYRRYSQFLKLHNSLPDELRNEMPMPPKRFQGHLTDVFVTKRKQELQAYIHTLLAVDKNRLIGTDVGSFLGCDLHSRKKNSGNNKPTGLSNSRKKNQPRSR